MNSKYTTFKLKEVTNYINRGITPAYDEEGVKVINQRCIRDQKLDLNDSKFTNPKKRNIPEAKYLKKYDVLVNSTGIGTLGRIAQIKKEFEEPLTVDSHVTLVRPNDKLVDGLYFGYAMMNAEQHITFLGEGSTGQIELSRKLLASEIEIYLPPIETQRDIATILNSLDSKIELNQRMNQTLEEIGRAIFKQWFVDFEFPDEKGRPYKSSGGEIVDSALGEIPKGWELKPLDQVANFLNGLALQKYPPVNEVEFLPVIKIRELKQGITQSTDKASHDIPREYIVNDGDVLFSWSGSLELVLWSGGAGALNQHLFKVTSNDYPKWFYFYQINENLKRFREIAAGKATTMGHIQRHHLSETLIAIPPTEIMKKANELIAPLIDNFVNNDIESQKLSKIRDSLLPKLMSGKIRVKGDE